MKAVRWFFVAAMSATVFTTPAQGQAGADRKFFDDLLAQFNHIGNTGQLPDVTKCASLTGSAARLCEALILVRKSEFTMDVGDLGKAREMLERTVGEQPKWPVAWYALGMMRFEGARSKGLSREGPDQPLGTSSEYGGSLALIHAITLDSTFLPAIEALAMAPLPREGVTKYGERLAALRAVRESLSGTGKYGAGLIEFESGNSAEAVSLFKEALRDPKIDRGMVRLAMGRALYKMGNPADGRVVLIAGANDTSTASRYAYRKMLGFVATPEELASWDSVKAGDHGAWFARFWSERDAREGRKDGDRLAEHFRRMEFAIKNYLLKEVQMGQQSVSSSAKKVSIAEDEISARYFNDLRAKIQAEAADTVEATSMMVAAEIASGAYSAPFRVTRALRDKLDDRGIVYVRYGKPDEFKEVGDDGGAALWVYHLPDGDMALAFRAESFSGNTGSTRIVPHLADLPESVRQQFCGIRPSLCEIQTTSSATSMDGPNSALRREAEAGMASLTKATSTDGYARVFVKPMRPSIQVLSLNAVTGGVPRLVVAFAIPGDQLAFTNPPEAQGNAVYPLRVQLALSRKLDGKRIDQDTLRVFAIPKALTGTEYLSQTAEFLLQPGTYSGAVVLSQDGGAGAIVHVPEIVIPDETASLGVSDLVIGRPGAVVWKSGTMSVPLNPLNTFPKGSEANVYLQLHGLVKDQPYAMVFEIFKGTETTKPDVTINFNETATAERTELSKSLSFPDLDPGQYRVRLTVKTGGKEVSTSAGLRIVKP